MVNGAVEAPGGMDSSENSSACVSPSSGSEPTKGSWMSKSATFSSTASDTGPATDGDSFTSLTSMVTHAAPDSGSVWSSVAVTYSL